MCCQIDYVVFFYLQIVEHSRPPLFCIYIAVQQMCLILHAVQKNDTKDTNLILTMAAVVVGSALDNLLLCFFKFFNLFYRKYNCTEESKVITNVNVTVIISYMLCITMLQLWYRFILVSNTFINDKIC